jgi:tetratricopeptide (TPR) repeat protein
MAEMLEARDRGQIVRGEADFHLHHMYLWYEHQPARALALVDGLERRYPHNPVFPLEIADVQDVYQHDHAASLVTYRRVLQAARDGRLVVPAIAEARARLGMAQQLDALAESDMAVEELKMVIAMRPVAPYGALARAQLGLGQAYDRLGQRARAVSAYEAARAAAPPNDPAAVRARVAEGLQRKPDARAAEAYRLSLEGWRALERGALTEADAALARAVAISPDDPVILFRRGRLFQARDERARALEQYERVIGARPATLPTILASACLEAGRLLERSGQRTRAIEMYQRAARVSGAEAETRDAAVGALARLNAATRGQ